MTEIGDCPVAATSDHRIQAEDLSPNFAPGGVTGELNLETITKHHPGLQSDFHGFKMAIPADRKTGLPCLSKIS